jgi:predicted nucleotidyltransferase
MPDSNLEQLVAAAQLLRPLLGALVFVGGSVTGLLITDEAAGEPRITLDVDAIAEITSYAEYAAFGDRLRVLGFTEDTNEGAPLCRWVHAGTILDVMPLDEKILGFSNRWYRAAMDAATTRQLAEDLEIRVVTAPFFLATKLEAFKGRGKGDFSGSRDLEDLIAVVDGRAAAGYSHCRTPADRPYENHPCFAEPDPPSKTSQPNFRRGQNHRNVKYGTAHQA